IAGGVEPVEVQAAIDEVNRELPHYRQIRNFKLIGNAFTPESGLLTLNGKLRRDAVSARFASEIYAMYEEKKEREAGSREHARKSVFSAGGDLRELYHHAMSIPEGERLKGIRRFLERIHAVMNAIDATPFVTIAAVHGACFGGGLELALACDIIVADKMARFAFPELRLGFIPGFGGVPRLKRDLGNAVVRDLLFTGRTLNASRAHALGLVAQLAG